MSEYDYVMELLKEALNQFKDVLKEWPNSPHKKGWKEKKPNSNPPSKG